MTKIEDYNDEVKNWDIHKDGAQEFLRLLTERNFYIQGQTPLVDFHSDFNESPKNFAAIDSNSINNLENIAFHVGFPHQKKLCALIYKHTKNKNNEGVFFSFRPEDVIYFSEFEKEPLSMVYLLDSNSTNEARLQIKYDSSVISRYDLDDILVSKNKKDKIQLKEMHKKLNSEWIEKNTIPFDVNQLREYRKKEHNWLIVPDPVEIKY